MKMVGVDRFFYSFSIELLIHYRVQITRATYTTDISTNKKWMLN